MTDQPLVSIVVLVYNTEKYLSDCLESLLAQTEKNIEILAVDDGSSDGSPAVLRRYAANCPQIRIFTQKNAGPGAARNTALKMPVANMSCFAIPTICLSPQCAAKWLR